MQKSPFTFSNRAAAGRALAAELREHNYKNPVLLALPRGGVPVAYEVARILRVPLDLVMVRKLGAPGHAEYAIGAIVDGAEPHLVLDQEAVDTVGASPQYIEAAKKKGLREIDRRRALYGVSDTLDLTGRTAIVIDDGIATGSTVRAALIAIRNANPTRIVLAVPVSPASSLADLAPLFDDVICLLQPYPFYAVGAHYDDFGQTSDKEVVQYLKLAREFVQQAEA